MTAFTSAGSAAIPAPASVERKHALTAAPSWTVVPARSNTTSSIIGILSSHSLETVCSASPKDNVMPAPPTPVTASTPGAGFAITNASVGCLTYTPCHRAAMVRSGIVRKVRR